MNEIEVLKIGSLSVKPIAMQWSESDLDSNEGSGRNALGDMFRDRICTKRKLSVSFPPMLTNQISKILKTIDPVFFEITYPDLKLGEATRKWNNGGVKSRKRTKHGQLQYIEYGKINRNTVFSTWVKRLQKECNRQGFS